MERNLLNRHNVTSQDMLRRVEALCTAEEPAACEAACPLHVNVRELCKLCAEGSWDAAFKLYRKAVPLALVLGYICDAPCKQRCKREGLGGAIEMRLIERALCAAAGKPAAKPLLLSSKKQRAAIVGGSLRGLSAAHDLAKKGYKVTIFEKTAELGGSLRRLPADVLPPAALEAELAYLLSLKVTVEYSREVTDPAALLDEGGDAFDGVYVACDAPHLIADPQTQLVAGFDKLLAGRKANALELGDGPVYQIYDGRAAASTLDRLFQGVNVSAGREREGGGETSLFTSLDGIAPQPAAQPGTGADYTATEAQQEAARCLQCACLECVKKCGFLQHYKRNPRQYVREVYNNLSIAMGDHNANGMINTCSLCSQCEAVCPNGLDMAQVFRAARERMTATGKMPQSAFEFGLLDMGFSLSDACFLARHQAGHAASAALFFPGCQLSASEPGLVRAAYDDLCARVEGGVGLMLGCCGIPAFWAGDETRFAQAQSQLREAWEGLGKPPVIAACPTCAQTLRERMGIPTETLFETLSRIGPANNRTDAGEMTLHHACGTRHDDAAKRGVQALAAACGVQDAGESDLWSESPCCGYGGLAPLVNAEVAGETTRTGLAQLGDSTTPVLTYCVNCRDRYLAEGRAASHLLELIYPQSGANHAPPTWSQRQDNRAALKRTLLEETWGETVDHSPQMQLFIDAELERKLEDTHILHSDIATVIAHAESTGDKLVDPATGHFTAYHRPANVTFWVEYAPEGGGARVFNAYSHRMSFVLTDSMTQGGQHNG